MGRMADSISTDEELYERFRRDKSEADLLVLVEKHMESLSLFINGYVHDETLAQELAMDTFAEVAAGPTLFSVRSSFKTWLFSVGKNLALKYLRKSRYSVMSPVSKAVSIDEMEEHTYDGEADPTGSQILNDERSRQLYEAMRQINEDYRRVLVLLYFEGMSRDEAALVMGRNKKQIYNLIERGKKALREELIKRGFEYDNSL